MGRLEGKRCVVTGGAKGIGRAIVEAFIAEGGHVVLADIDLEGKRISASLGCDFQPLDVRDEASWLDLAAHVPQVDVVVNNAGITGLELGNVPHDPEHASLADWRAVHQVNLDGVFLGCRYAIRAMKAQGEGSIINLSSCAGQVGVPDAAAYAASKAAIRNHSKSVALYCARQGWRIRCNSVHPGAILTPMWDAALGNGEAREANIQAAVADTPLRRFGRPDEVAALAVMLASDEATFITGSEFNIDGGLLAGAGRS